jgi:hypothetical protein
MSFLWRRYSCNRTVARSTADISRTVGFYPQHRNQSGSKYASFPFQMNDDDLRLGFLPQYFSMFTTEEQLSKKIDH